MPDVQRTGSAAPGSAAFKTARQGLAHSTVNEWYGVGFASGTYDTGGVASGKSARLAGRTTDFDGRNEQAVTSICREDG